jgi:hypothetical protein
MPTNLVVVAMKQIPVLTVALVLALSCSVIDSVIISQNNNNRHVCLFQSYSFVRGPHFCGLFDQLVEQTGFDQKRIAFLTIHDDMQSKNTEWSNDIGIDLDASVNVIRLDTINPIELDQQIQEFNPTVLWIADARSSLQLRYYMRTSGLDGLVERLCGSLDEKSLLYVGEGAGVICGGSHMALAKGQDPAPEAQFRGLELLGPDISVSFDLLATTDGQDGAIMRLSEKQLYVLSQRNGEAMSFVMIPSQMGAIEKLCHPEPVPPLVEEDVGGRRCTGEPSVDPSRMLQMQGDSEWFEECS